MDVKMEWKKAGERGDEELSALLDMPAIAQLTSRDPLEKIRRAMLINACWGLLIGAGYVGVLLRYPYWQLVVCIGFVLLITLWGVTRTLLLYRKLNRPGGDNTLLQEMERHYHYIRQWMKLQQWAGLLIYPFAVTGGFILGGCLGSGQPVDVFLQKPDMALTLVLLVVILVPTGFGLARWMSDRAFGQYARKLKANLEALRNG
jgi:hypothetical protein